VVERNPRGEGYTGTEDSYSGYTVYDMHYEKIGKVDDLFVDENDRPEYIGVKMGLLGTKSTLIPMDIVRINERRELMEVSQPKEKVKDAPTFSNDDEITPEFEREVRSFFDVQATAGARSGYGEYYRSDEDYSSSRHTNERGRTDEERRSERTRDEDRLSSEERYHGEERHHDQGRSRHDQERYRDEEHSAGQRSGAIRGDEERERGRSRGERGGDLDDRDEIRVQRSEEELVAGTREREAGAMRVRKRVRTDRESLAVPKRREEVHIERVPVEESQRASGTNRGASPEARMEDDEIVVPIVEEEIVVEKRPVVKEEIRIRKDIVEEEDVVEADVRKEEIDIDDQTRTSRGTR
jgi:uncharacterized protein (TIGR02271 family)